MITGNEAQSPNPSAFSDLFTKCVNIEPDLNVNPNFDRPWSDGLKRKKFWLKPSKEILNDDTQMTKSEKILTNIDSDDNELFNRDQRVRNWIKDYTKMVQSKKDKCDCAKPNGGSLTPLLQVNLNRIEALNKKAKHANQCQVNHLKINHLDKNEKCDLSKCGEPNNRFNKEKCCTCNVQNRLPLTELPKQLKLEQFLQHLSTITDPTGSSKCSDLISLDNITNNSFSNDQLINCEHTKESPLSHQYKEVSTEAALTSSKRLPLLPVLSKH
jgi:hypothetical protein